MTDTDARFSDRAHVFWQLRHLQPCDLKHPNPGATHAGQLVRPSPRAEPRPIHAADPHSSKRQPTRRSELTLAHRLPNPFLGRPNVPLPGRQLPSVQPSLTLALARVLEREIAADLAALPIRNNGRRSRGVHGVPAPPRNPSWLSLPGPTPQRVSQRPGSHTDQGQRHRPSLPATSAKPAATTITTLESTSRKPATNRRTDKRA
jgi:hypothetical protein